MNAKLFAVSAAVLSLAAATVQAAPNPAVQAFLDDAYSQAKAQLGGVDLSHGVVKVRAHVHGDGRLTGVRVVKSSGSRDADERVVGAVKQVRVRQAPLPLIGSQVDFAFGPADAEAAQGR